MTDPVEELVAALKKRIDIDNYIISGSNGPLMDVGFSMGWKMAREIVVEEISRFNAERGRQPDDAMVERVDRVLRERAYALNRPRAWRLEVVREALIAAINPEAITASQTPAAIPERK